MKKDKPPEIGEILYITEINENLLGIPESLKGEEVRIIHLYSTTSKGRIDIMIETTKVFHKDGKPYSFTGYFGTTFIRKAHNSKTICPICGSEEDFCICKLLIG